MLRTIFNHHRKISSKILKHFLRVLAVELHTSKSIFFLIEKFPDALDRSQIKVSAASFKNFNFNFFKFKLLSATIPSTLFVPRRVYSSHIADFFPLTKPRIFYGFFQNEGNFARCKKLCLVFWNHHGTVSTEMSCIYTKKW